MDQLPKSPLGLTTTTKAQTTTILEESALQTLHYFGYFEHALRVEEVHKYLNVKASLAAVETALNRLLKKGAVSCNDGLWALDEAHCYIREKHLKRNARMLRAAKVMGRFIQSFPFVRGVYLSGSLSKHGVTTKEDDLDFFIITKSGRVWATKLLLIAFKKVFLFNNEKYFCINLLMAEDQLELKKHNLYIATEAASLIPLTNPSLLREFWEKNPFVLNRFPNLELPKKHSKQKKLRVVEAIIDSTMGKALERSAHNRFKQHVEEKRKESGYYDTSEGVSAYFPESVEERVLNHMAKSNLKDE